MTLTQITQNPVDGLAARYDRARDALTRLMEPENSERWAMLDGKLYVEASDTVNCWITDGQTCSCPDSRIGTASRYLGGTCRHVALHWLLAHQRAVRDAVATDDDDSGLTDDQVRALGA